MKMRHVLTTGLLVFSPLVVSPLASALAQGGTGPDVSANSRTEARSVNRGAAANTHKPGATGRTVVPGNNSTVAGNHAATAKTKTGGGGGGESGGGGGGR